METQKNSENNIVLEMKRLLGRMMVQVDYMYRNDREMSRLDLDIMMERTRDFYDLLCDYQSDKVENEVLENEPVSTEINEGGELINHNLDLEIETPEEVLREPDINGENDGDDKGLDFKDEMIEDEEVEEAPEVEEVPEIEEKPEIDEITEIEEIHEIEEKPADIKHVLEVEEDDADEEDWEDEDDEMFRVETVEEAPAEEMKPAEEEKKVEVEETRTVNEIKPVEEDNSLAARLQRTPVKDIRMAMGINDKMMVVNDLFRGSVERYNKSIDALNDFATLSGAKVYMSELQIELQWDTESQAYKMLNDLVERRFI